MSSRSAWALEPVQASWGQWPRGLLWAGRPACPLRSALHEEVISHCVQEPAGLGQRPLSPRRWHQDMCQACRAHTALAHSARVVLSVKRQGTLAGEAGPLCFNNELRV